MPAAIEYDPEARALREAADKEFSDRQKLIKANRAYYDGNHAPQMKDARDNVILNLSRQVVDETVAFLVPEMPSLELDADMSSKNADEEYLADVWKASGGATLLSSLAINGGLGGQTYARIAEFEGEERQILTLNPANIISWWNADDMRDVLWYELRWQEQDLDKNKASVSRRTIDYRQDVVKSGRGWEILDFRKDNHKWTLIDTTMWPYETGPIVDWQHLPAPTEYYGEHELPHRALNDAINKVASDIQSILRYHAFPTTVVTGAEAGDIKETSIDGLMSISSEQAKVYNVEMQSDLVASMTMLQTLKDQFFSQARVVVIRGSLDMFRGMTNLGIRAAFMPMIAKNETLRRQYGDGIQRICQTLLAMAGRDATQKPDVQWGEALPVDQSEELALLERQMAQGLMSKQTAALRLGLDWDTEQAQINTEAMEDNFMRDGFPVGVSG